MLHQGGDRGPFGSGECTSLSDAQAVSGRRIATPKRREKEDIHVRPKEVEEVTNYLERVGRGAKRRGDKGGLQKWEPTEEKMKTHWI